MASPVSSLALHSEEVILIKWCMRHGKSSFMVEHTYGLLFASGCLTTSSISSPEDRNWSTWVVYYLVLSEIEWDYEVATVLRCGSDTVLLSLGAFSGCSATIHTPLTCTLGFGAGHAATTCAALCDDRSCYSELLRSVIQAVGTIEYFKQDPDDSATL